MGKCNVTLNCFFGQPVGTLVDSMWGNPNVMASMNGAGQRVGKSRRDFPQKCPSPWGSTPPSNTYFLRLSRFHIPNSISISSAFCRAHGSYRQTQTMLLRALVLQCGLMNYETKYCDVMLCVVHPVINIL